MTMTAPRKPCTQVHSDAQPKLTTKSGMASGTTTSTAQTRRPGRLVRSTHQAAAVAITAGAGGPRRGAAGGGPAGAGPGAPGDPGRGSVWAAVTAGQPRASARWL